MKKGNSPEFILTKSPIIPVVVLDDVRKAPFLARALNKGGIGIIEITLRTECALSAISLIKRECPEMLVGAGTVLNKSDLEEVVKTGAHFAISPGITNSLLESASDIGIPLIPGISTVSELMTGLEAGFSYFKFFPAMAAGGLDMLKALSGPFPNVKFCPTGGITALNFTEFLALDNVLCIGGSWLCPKALIERESWDEIAVLCRSALKKVGLKDA